MTDTKEKVLNFCITNVFVKPNEQSQTRLNLAMARKRRNLFQLFFNSYLLCTQNNN